MDKSINTEKRVLIFGIGGFVGSYLAKEFMEEGYKVYGSDILKQYVRGVKTKTIDILDPVAVTSFMEDIQPDMIINLAAVSSVGLSWKIPVETVMVNVIGSLNIQEAARKLKSEPKLLFIGSSEEYADTDRPISEDTLLDAGNPYGISKTTQEQFAKIYREHYGLKVFCVRAFNHTGIGQTDSFVLPSFCKQVAEITKSGKPGVIRVGNLSVKRDFGHVKDMVRAYRMILEQGDCSKVYNVGYGKAYSLDELLNYIVSLSNQPIKVEVDKERMRLADNPVICCDNSRIKKELGWEPEYSVFDALNEMYANYSCTGL